MVSFRCMTRYPGLISLLMGLNYSWILISKAEFAYRLLLYTNSHLQMIIYTCWTYVFRTLYILYLCKVCGVTSKLENLDLTRKHFNIFLIFLRGLFSCESEWRYFRLARVPCESDFACFSLAICWYWHHMAVISPGSQGRPAALPTPSLTPLMLAQGQGLHLYPSYNLYRQLSFSQLPPFFLGELVSVCPDVFYASPRNQLFKMLQD